VPIGFSNNGSFSGSFWVKFNTLAASVDIISYVSASAGYIIRVATNGDVTFFCGTGSGYQSVTVVGLIVTGEWYHIGFTRLSSGSIKLTVSPMSGNYSPMVTSASSAYTTPNIIGTWTSNAALQNVLVDSLFLWADRPLADAEFSLLHNNGVGRSWPLSV
jgi:hypothetical protein